MFASRISAARGRLREGLDLAIEFATLGEYDVAGPLEPSSRASACEAPLGSLGAGLPSARPERRAPHRRLHPADAGACNRCGSPR
jgi:hypothetical protein